MEEIFHTPVLLREVIEGLRVEVGKKYIDATLGGGGHGLEIVKKGGIVLGIDCDYEAIDFVKSKVKSEKLKVEIGKDLILVHGNFRDLAEIARKHGFDRVAGIIFDLGVSSHQLNKAERGFSFQKDAPLDMRMDSSAGHSTLRDEPSGSDSKSSGQAVTAADLVNGLYKNELIYIFEKFAGEEMARLIADAIVSARNIKKIETTGELAAIVAKVKRRRGNIHPATKVFQALRVAVNDELGSLEKALPQAADLLEKGGRMAVISFHSLEDRIVKEFFKGRQLTKKPITPLEEEVRVNTRARSAKLRIYEKN